MKIAEHFDKYIGLLPLPSASTVNLKHEAESRACSFLEAMGSVLNLKHLLTSEQIHATSIHSAVYAQQLDRAQAKTITESKVIAEASNEYVKARESLENINNDVSYLKSMYELFLNAHLFYRQLCKED